MSVAPEKAEPLLALLRKKNKTESAIVGKVKALAVYPIEVI